MKLSLENRAQSITIACLRTGPSPTPRVAQREVAVPTLRLQPGAPQPLPASFLPSPALHGDLPSLQPGPIALFPATKAPSDQGSGSVRAALLLKGSQILRVRSQTTPKSQGCRHRRVWKNNVLAPLLIYSPIFTAALQTLTANVFVLAKAGAHMCRVNAWCFVPPSTTHLQEPSARTSAQPLSSPPNWEALLPATELSAHPTQRLQQWDAGCGVHLQQGSSCSTAGQARGRGAAPVTTPQPCMQGYR